MKKTALKLLPLLLMTVLTTALWSCDDDNDEVITSNELPVQAKTFITQYFPTAKVVTAQKDKDEYDVVLSDGTKIEFDRAGEWQDVDAPMGVTIPTGFYPAAIDTYLTDNLITAGINEISKEKGGYEIELTTGTELHFSADGSFIRTNQNQI